MSFSSPKRTKPKHASELTHVNEEMYKKNLELSDRNKTLSLLRKIDEIVLSKVTDTKQIAEGVAEAVIGEGSFSLFAIYVMDRQHLSPNAVSIRPDASDLEKAIKAVFRSRVIVPADSKLIAKAIASKQTLSTGSVADLIPLRRFSAELAPKIRAVMQVESFYFCPMTARGEVIGALIIGNRQLAGELSSFQKNLIERLTGVIGIAMDNALLYIELQSATNRLKQANHHLKELDKAKDEFISMASHQLRTPLTTIKGYLSMLLEGDAGPVSKTQKEFLENSFGGSERMVGLISDMLNVSRMTAGRFVIQAQPTDLTALVEEEVKQLKTHAMAKNLELNFKPPANLPLVELDEGKTRQVVMNFIDNAIYYTKTGGVAVTLEADEELARFKVKDTGIGVPSDAKAKLFSKFYRADNARDLRPDGTGLGLFLAKRVIEDQGGKIIFDSIEGKGSTFGFELPLKRTIKS